LRDGRDITLIAIGPLVNTCLQAALELRHRGIEAAVINLRYIKPLDRELLIRYARLTKRLVTVEDHELEGGMGSAVLEVLADEGLTNVVVERLGYDGFVNQGSIPQLQQEHGLSVKGIIGAVERLKGFQSAVKR